MQKGFWLAVEYALIFFGERFATGSQVNSEICPILSCRSGTRYYSCITTQNNFRDELAFYIYSVKAAFVYAIAPLCPL